jgi:hypothetical protein
MTFEKICEKTRKDSAETFRSKEAKKLQKRFDKVNKFSLEKMPTLDLDGGLPFRFK